MAGDLPWSNGRLIVSENGRFLQHEDGTPFFWLGDTAWLLTRLTREEAIVYLDDRREKGFNVIQMDVIHSVKSKNAYGRQPLIDEDFTKPDLAKGPNGEPSYWDHLDFLVDEAAKRGMYAALVCVWGSEVKRGALNEADATVYGKWLGERYKDRPNIIWFIGGDVHGTTMTQVWLNLANAIKSVDPNHLMTFHPFGRTQSSTWFHHEPWLDFNVYQSGHRRYDQIGDEHPATWKGEDNWRFALEDYARYPAKPTLDAEPSYEGIPQGLHDPKEGYWEANDIRRFAYWSVFAGACGHTYGHSAIMQMHKPEYGKGAYGVQQYWYQALNATAGTQMQHLKKLMLSRPYFDRIPDPTVVYGDPGYRYNRLLVTRGKDYLFAYIYTGRPFELKMGHISGETLNAYWYNPKDGTSQSIGTVPNKGVQRFIPPGEPKEGNDWVLVLDDASKNYPPIGPTSQSKVLKD